MARPTRFAQVAAWPIAALLAIVSLAGLVARGTYAQERPAWAAEAVGQDWFDLLIAVPCLAICGVRARAGSYRWNVLLAGAYAYVVYELAIYAFAVHFNALFFAYCATLGLASYALIASLGNLGLRPEPVERGTARLAGGWLVALGGLFAIMWLVEDVPAVERGLRPASLEATGLVTNPVHVIDLSFVLPAHVIAGVLLWRRRAGGAVLAPVLLAFGVLMSASIGGMMLAIRLAGGAGPIPVIVAMFIVTAITAALLWRVLYVSVHTVREGLREDVRDPSQGAPGRV
ncbi:MAG: hypothetical protein ACM31C_34420 [Acidobacteriota bacterium]